MAENLETKHRALDMRNGRAERKSIVRTVRNVTLTQHSLPYLMDIFVARQTADL